MARRKLSRNAPCPCGSGRKYKHCCWGKGFAWVGDDQGHVLREVPLSAEAVALLEQQRQQFRQRFGRDPRPDDRLFFEAPPLEQVEHQIVEAMKRAGLDPALIYAFEERRGGWQAVAGCWQVPALALRACRSRRRRFGLVSGPAFHRARDR